MVVYTRKKSGELNYLTPHVFWNISDFGAKCEKYEMINTIAGTYKKPVFSQIFMIGFVSEPK
jgi:hypothetical protein